MAPIPVIHHVPTTEKMCCLTFDDGPHPDYTPKLLDLLQRYDAYCTFFMSGECMENYPELVVEVFQRGHEIGNHTRNHPNLTELSEQDIYTEIEWAHHEIFRLTDQYPRFFRPPYGFYNEHVLKVCQSFGYQVVLWSDGLEMFDWELPGVDVLVNTLLSNVHTGCIVLLHDYGGDRSQTVAAVQEVLPILKKRGYQLVRIDQLVGSVSRKGGNDGYHPTV